jgi:ribonuclease Z
MPRLAGHLVEGISIGGVETCIDLPELKLAFDIGRCPDQAVNRPTILFTHAHMDHMGGVAWHAATRDLRGMPAPTYVVPRENEEAFHELFAVWRKLDRAEAPHHVVALLPGEEWALPNKLVARPFRSPHRVPCQGYVLWSRKRKLRAEHRGKREPELRDLRKQIGDAMTEQVEVPEVAFTGDTLIEVVENEEAVRKARLLVIEVTFVDDRVSVAECRSKGHVHLFEVIERAHLFENEALLFTHFSARYQAHEIVAALERHLPPSLRERVTPLLPPRGPAFSVEER